MKKVKVSSLPLNALVRMTPHGRDWIIKRHGLIVELENRHQTAWRFIWQDDEVWIGDDAAPPITINDNTN